jgi:hypothetical protein
MQSAAERALPAAMDNPARARSGSFSFVATTAPDAPVVASTWLATFARSSTSARGAMMDVPPVVARRAAQPRMNGDSG